VLHLAKCFAKERKLERLKSSKIAQYIMEKMI